MESTTHTRTANFLRVGQAALAFFGANTSGNRARIIRMVDRGELAAIRHGERGDRLIPARELDRLLAEAEANRVNA